MDGRRLSRGGLMNEQLPQLTPKNLAEAIEFCNRLAKTDFVPSIYKNKPGEILAAIQMGAEVGIGPMQALSSIAVINGRPSLYGDVMLALVERSGLLAYHREYHEGDTAVCEVQRKGEKDVHVVKFSQADAIKAKLANKQGPWTDYPARMRQWRARGFALRDKFPDVLRGLISREEAMDMPTNAKHVGPSISPVSPVVGDEPKRNDGEFVVVGVPDAVDGVELKDEVSHAGSESVGARSAPPRTSATPCSGGADDKSLIVWATKLCASESGNRVLNDQEQVRILSTCKRAGVKMAQVINVLYES